MCVCVGLLLVHRVSCFCWFARFSLCLVPFGVVASSFASLHRLKPDSWQADMTYHSFNMFWLPGLRRIAWAVLFDTQGMREAFFPRPPFSFWGGRGGDGLFQLRSHRNSLLTNFNNPRRNRQGGSVSLSWQGGVVGSLPCEHKQTQLPAFSVFRQGVKGVL